MAQKRIRRHHEERTCRNLSRNALPKNEFGNPSRPLRAHGGPKFSVPIGPVSTSVASGTSCETTDWQGWCACAAHSLTTVGLGPQAPRPGCSQPPSMGCRLYRSRPRLPSENLLLPSAGSVVLPIGQLLKRVHLLTTGAVVFCTGNQLILARRVIRAGERLLHIYRAGHCGHSVHAWSVPKYPAPQPPNPFRYRLIPRFL